MKKLMMLIAGGILSAALPLAADTETVGDYTWTYRISGNTAEIYGSYNRLTYDPAISPLPTGAVTIPSTLGGKPVTSIGERAFYNCSGLTSVTIPDSVTSIGDWAFYGCSGLTSVTIPDSVTSIGDGAFRYCYGLTSVTIPDSVTSIGDGAFAGCYNLESISVAAGNQTYKIDSGLLLTKDGKLLIAAPGRIENVAIPDSVTSIAGSAFQGCTDLTSVTIPDSVTSIGKEAFQTCCCLTSVTIGNGVTSIGEGAFADCIELTSVTIGNSVTSIGDYAFSGCGSLTDVTIPDSVTSIGESAFKSCSGLASVTIPDSVTSIGESAFQYCSGLASVTIGNGVTSIGYDAFWYCSGLKSFVVASGNVHYKAVSGLLLTKDGKMLVAIPGGLTSVTIPNSVTSIGDDAFAWCSGLTGVTIPDSVTSIGAYAFAWCSGLTGVTIPDSVTSIGSSAFYNCTNLTNVHVVAGDADRVRSMLDGSGFDVSGVTFIEDVEPSPVTPEPVTPEPVTPEPVTPAPVTPDPVTSTPVTPSYDVIEPSDITAAFEAPKAVTLTGAVYDGNAVVGIVELKLGKVNKGKGKVSGTVTTLDGKKHTIKAYNLTGIDGAKPEAVSLDVKDLGTMTVTIGGEQFAGSLGKYHVQSATVGGNWAGRGATVTVDADDLAMFAGRVLSGLLPKDEQAAVNNGKWTFNKAAGVKWAKPKADASRSEYYDATSGKDLIVDDTKGKTNMSGLKLTYTPKKGTFKGSFKVYALEGEGKATKLKKYNVNVSGVVVGGVGYGTATCKKPALSWPVTVE